MWPLVLSGTVMGTAIVLAIPSDALLGRILLTPMASALLLCLMPQKENSLHKTVSLFFSLGTLLLCMRLWSVFLPSAVEPFQHVIGFQRAWSGLLSVNLEFGVDRLSLWMMLLTAALLPLAILCSWKTQDAHSQAFFRLLMVLESFLLRTFTSLDVLCFYILYECSLIPMFLLIGLGGSRPRKVRAAYLLVLYTLVGSLAMLPCLLLLLRSAGTTNYLVLRHLPLDSRRQTLLWWGFFLAFRVKVPLMPLHLWLPEAHVERSTRGSVLLAGVLLKLGTYGLLRYNLWMFPEATTYFSPRVNTLCLIGVVYRSLTTLRQVDLKKIVAYSSVAHMSMVVLALFSLNQVAVVGRIFTMLAHGVRSPALFLCVGALYDRYHTKRLKYLGGAATGMPIFRIFFFFFSLCNMRLPLSPNFIGEFLSLCGIFRQNPLCLIVRLGGVILRAVYSLWAYSRVVHGLPKIHYISGMADLNRREFFPLRILLRISLWWGIKPSVVLDSLESLVSTWTQLSSSTHHGFEAERWALL